MWAQLPLPLYWVMMVVQWPRKVDWDRELLLLQTGLSLPLGTSKHNACSACSMTVEVLTNSDFLSSGGQTRTRDDLCTHARPSKFYQPLGIQTIGIVCRGVDAVHDAAAHLGMLETSANGSTTHEAINEQIMENKITTNIVISPNNEGTRECKLRI